MAIVKDTDFIGEYKVSTSRFTDLDTFIAKYEKFYLLRMLGADLYALFIADLSNTNPQVPTAARFLAFFNPFNKIPSLAGSLYISEGIKQMLVQFIYFHFTRESNINNSITGQVESSNENNTSAKYRGNLINAYNEGVTNYCVIQEYIESDSVLYPEYQASQVEYLNYSSGI